jgi:hypothetical protein
MYECLGLFFSLSVETDYCTVSVFADKKGKYFIDSFTLLGKHGEDTFYEMAYEYVYDNEADFKTMEKCNKWDDHRTGLSFKPFIKIKGQESLFIASYSNNGKKITIRLTDKQEDSYEVKAYLGKRYTFEYCYDISPILTIRDVIMNSKEMGYLNNPEVKMAETHTFAIGSRLSDETLFKDVPLVYFKYKGIKPGTKIEIIDEVNDKTTVWKYSEDNVKIKQGVAGNYVLDFGRHVGKTIEQVYNEDPQYLDWILTKSDFNNNEVKVNITLYKIMIGYNITNDKISELINTCPAK